MPAIHLLALSACQYVVKSWSVFRRRFLADFDVRRPLYWREIGNLIYPLKVSNSDTFQVTTREQMVLLKRDFRTLDGRIDQRRDFNGAVKCVRIELDQSGLIGEQRRAASS